MYCGVGHWLGAGWAHRARAERAGGALGMQVAWALGARPGLRARDLGAGRAGWPWAVHSVHSAHFRSVLTRFFS